MKAYLKYKNRLEGLDNIYHALKAIEKDAASQLHSLRQQVENLNNYQTDISQTLSRLIPFYSPSEHPLLTNKEEGSPALLFLTGNRGLVGGVWHQLTNKFLKHHSRKKIIIVIGSKGYKYLQEEGVTAEKKITDFSNIPKQKEIFPVEKYIFRKFQKGDFSKVEILYPKYVSLTKQIPKTTTFLPFKFELTKSDSDQKSKNVTGWPLFEPSKEAVFDHLLQGYIKIRLHKIILETKLSELSARTTTTEHGAEKTEEKTDKMRVQYRKERKQDNTQRQLESFVAHKTK